jgi:hypothetical protein
MPKMTLRYAFLPLLFALIPTAVCSEIGDRQESNAMA